MIDIHVVVGARPNFIKVGPLFHELSATDWERPTLVHTGQHSSPEMSDDILRELGLPEPDVHLAAKGSTHGQLTADVLVKYEEVLIKRRPDLVIVVGDVNSTIAACLAAKKLNITVAHLEAGLRSFDRTMPEEINRILTDSISDILWTPSRDADENLSREGVERDRIRLVGNIMIDAYEYLREQIENHGILGELGYAPKSYAVLTLHRPSNVDEVSSVRAIMESIEEISSSVPIIFPIHPRTEKVLRAAGLMSWVEGFVRVVPPQSYISFMSLVRNAKLLITDSGGVQEESSYLGVPCLTLRENTERPVTVELGTNMLCSRDTLLEKAQEVIQAEAPRVPRIPLWDGETSGRIVADLKKHFVV